MPEKHGTLIGYPTDRMLGVFADPTDAAAAAAALTAAGIATRDITLLRGEEGADRLDGRGADGVVGRTRRAVSFTFMDQLPDMAWYERAVRDGGAVLMVRARGDDRKALGVATMRANHGHFINYYGRFATKELERWHGPDPKIADVLA